MTPSFPTRRASDLLLPTVAEKDRHWAAKIDIIDAPELQLVLPARKEMVENGALQNLRAAVRLSIYRHIQTLGSHRLRSEEHTSELQSLMRISYAVFCLKKKKHKLHTQKIKL